jgi:putative transposase
MSVPDAKRLKELETENVRLKKLLAEQVLENEVIKDALRKKW